MSDSQVNETPKAPPAISYASTEGMVTVEVGPRKTKHQIHKALLVHHSEYFARALAGPWSESEERRVTLDDVDADASHSSTGFIPNDFLMDFPSFRSVVKGPAANPVDYVNNALTLLKAYALGGRVLAANFRHEISNSYIRRRDGFSTSSLVVLPQMIYASANNPQDRVILQFLVNDFCLRYDPNTLYKFDTSALMVLPPAFTARVIRRYGYYGCTKDHNSCYLEHGSEAAEQACEKTHMGFDGEDTDYGFFGEPRPK